MGKTITTYLIDGDPQGTRYVFISNKICKMVVIPRADLSIVNVREELQTPAFYILLGEDDLAKPKAYIGETENFKERVKDHDYKKTFWQKALVFVSKDAAMTKADVQYLEYMALSVAKKANRFSLDDNRQTPKAPNLPEHQKDSIDEFFDDIRFLTSFIGCNIFDQVKPKDKHLFYTQGRGCDARGFYDSTGFTVLKGSIIAKDAVPSLHWKDKRATLLKEYTQEKDGKLILESDKVFASPSTAADFCIGRGCNGWTTWKDGQGQTMDTIYRKRLEE